MSTFGVNNVMVAFPLEFFNFISDEKNMMFGFNMGGNHELLLNTLIFISKWSIWKARNKVKYDKIHINQNVLCNMLLYCLTRLLTKHLRCPGKQK
jgi:hypothetical protein